MVCNFGSRMSSCRCCFLQTVPRASFLDRVCMLSVNFFSWCSTCQLTMDRLLVRTLRTLLETIINNEKSTAQPNPTTVLL